MRSQNFKESTANSFDANLARERFKTSFNCFTIFATSSFSSKSVSILLTALLSFLATAPSRTSHATPTRQPINLPKSIYCGNFAHMISKVVCRWFLSVVKANFTSVESRVFLSVESSFIIVSKHHVLYHLEHDLHLEGRCAIFQNDSIEVTIISSINCWKTGSIHIVLKDNLWINVYMLLWFENVSFFIMT